MKKLFLLFLYLNFISFTQEITFPDKWLFKTGDDSSYKLIELDDSNWENISVPQNWENEGYSNYDGFAWYRLHFNIDNKYLNSELYLLVGKIDDVDEAFLNGIKIGGMGKFPPNDLSEWNTQRIYKIPIGLLKENNVLAVRVYDGSLGGGIWSGELGVFSKESYMQKLNLGPAPKKSFYQIVTSNGLIAAVFNEKKNEIEYILPHIFQSYDENKRVQPFIKNLKFNIKEKPDKISYLLNTHIINVQYPEANFFYFAPFTTQEKIFYIIAIGNEDEINKLNFSFEKNKTEVLIDSISIKSSGNKIQKYFLFSFNDSLHNNSQAIIKAKNNLIQKDILSEEINFMRNIILKCNIPKGLTNDERNLYEQSISILKMSQVSENEIFEKSHGQILASLPPGIWNIAWLRDGVYSVLALNQIGRFEEAKNALSFYLNADAGYYKNFVWKDGIDYGVKTNYCLTVCRYFGIGKEESDFNEFGPNIELDGFGLFLIAFTDYIIKSKDEKFLLDNFDIISKFIAEPILTFIESNSLIRKESGPWEQHLPGKQFAFTSIVNSIGLNQFAQLCKNYNLPDYKKYQDASEILLNGIRKNLIYNNEMLKGFNEAESPKTNDFFDGGTFEAFSFKLIQDTILFQKHFNAYEKGLRINSSRGFSRLNNPDWYTIGEWPFLNLRIALSLINFGFKNEAKQLIDWTTNYSKLNFNFIPELYNYENENYDGAVPMVGYGSGAYILTLSKYYSQ